MNTTHSESSTPSGGQAWEQAKETAAELELRGEECVSEHTGSAIGTAFVGGLVLGMLIGWRISESRHEDYGHAARRIARQLQHRLHLD